MYKLYVVTNHCVVLHVCLHMACITQHPLLLGMVMCLGFNKRDMNTNDTEHFQAKPIEVTHGLPRSDSVAPGDGRAI